MLNYIPILGWLISGLLAMSLAVPFYFIWNALASTYFYWLPEVYQELPYWHIVGLSMIIPIFKMMVVPKFASVSNVNNSGK